MDRCSDLPQVPAVPIFGGEEMVASTKRPRRHALSMHEIGGILTPQRRVVCLLHATPCTRPSSRLCSVTNTRDFCERFCPLCELQCLSSVQTVCPPS
jgi:hypothetical protein